MNSKKVLAFALAFCMLFSMLPVFSFASSVTVKYLDADFSEGYPVWSFSNSKTGATVGIVIDGNKGDTYTLTEDVTDLALFINEVDVTITNPSFSMFMISGNGSIILGAMKMSIANPTEPCTATTAGEFAAFYLDERFQNQDYSYTVIGDFELSGDIDPYNFTVEEGAHLTLSTILNVRNECRIDGSVYITSSSNVDAPNGLNVCENGTFILGQNGSLAAAPDQIFELGTNAKSYGLTLWDGDASLDTLEFEHPTMDFNYSNGKWIFANQQNPQGFMVDFDENLSAVSYNLGNGDVNCNSCELVEYDDASSVSITIDGYYYGIRVQYDDEEPTYYKASELVNSTYTITDTSKTCNILVINFERPFNSEYCFTYEYMNGAEILVNGETVENWEIMPFSLGYPISAQITSPEGVSGVYKIVAYYNDYEEIDITNYYNNGNLNYYPEMANGLEIHIFWTEEQYNFERFQTSEGNKTVEVYAFGGTVDIEAEHKAVYNSSAIAEIANDATTVNISLNPYEGYVFTSLMIYDKEYSVDDIIDWFCPGVTYNQETGILTVRLSGDDDYYYIGITFEEDNSGKCMIMFDSWDITAQYALGDGDFQDANDWDWVDFSADGSITVKFQANEQRTFYGIRLKNLTTETEKFIKASELNDNSYTITDTSSAYEIEALNYPVQFDNEYVVYYDEDNGGYVSTGPSGQINSMQYQYFVHFEFVLPQGVNNIYKLVLKVNGQEEQDVTSMIQGSNGSYFYDRQLGGSTAGFELRVYWTEEQYNFEYFYTTDDNYGLIVESINADAVTAGYMHQATYKNTAEFEVPANSGFATFNLPSGKELTSVFLDGDHFDIDNLPDYIIYDEQNGTISVDLDYCYNWSYLTLEFATDHAGEFSIDYPDWALVATLNINGITTTNPQQNEWRQFPSYGSVTITFTPTQNYNFYGIIVTDHVSKTVTYIKASDLKNNSYTITDFSKGYTIEAVTWMMAFDNEFYMDFDTSVNVPVTVNGVETDPWDSQSFTNGNPITIKFGFNDNVKSVYKVELSVTGTNEVVDITNLVKGDTLTYTPESIRGFSIRVYFSEEEYNFNNIYLDENQFEIRVWTNGSGTVSTDEAYSSEASYLNQVRYIVDYDESMSSFVLKLVPQEGEIIERVYVNGEELSAENFADGTITLNVEDCFDIFVDVEYSRYFDGIVAGDVDGNGIRDFADYALVCSATKAGTVLDDEQIRACDLNHDGVVDGFDAIYLDLILNGAIDF